jgi:hypothetical protein
LVLRYHVASSSGTTSDQIRRVVVGHLVVCRSSCSEICKL